jgi:hypothetical protein
MGFHRTILPGQMPRGPFDLIIVSELVYYLRPHHLKPLADRIVAALTPGGMTVLLNHRRRFDDATVLPAVAHRRVGRQLAKRMIALRDICHRHFDVAILQHRTVAVS